MSDALTNALADSQRSLLSCKASLGQSPEMMMAQGPGGISLHRRDLARAHEEVHHFKGWVYASIRPIAQRIAGQPIHVGRAKTPRKLGVKSPDDIQPLDDHPLVSLFADPNELMVAWSLMFSTVASLELTGRQLWWLPQQKKIYPIPTPWIRSFEGTTKYTSFHIQPPYGAEPYDIPADECVMFSYPDPKDPHGAYSPVHAVWGAVDSDEAIVSSQASMFRQGINPAHAIIVGKQPHQDIPGGIRPRLSAAQQRQIIDAIRKRYAGVRHHGDPLILDGLIEDVKSLSNSPKEMDFLKSGEAAKARIMQGLGVSPIIGGQVEGSNRASSDAADRHFTTYVVNPKIELMSQTLTGWCRYVFEDQTLVVWIEPCVPDDAATSLQWVGILAQYGAITGDELRGLSPFDLETGNFPNPVTPGKTQSDQQLDDAIGQVAKTLDYVDPLRVIGGDRHANPIEPDRPYRRNGRSKS